MATDRSKKSLALRKASEKLVMLAHKYDPNKHRIDASDKGASRNILGWYSQPKIDGVRAILKNGSLLTRTGKKLHAPKDFIENIKDQFGDLPLDGELSHKNGFQTTVSIVRDQYRKANMEHWSNITYTIFDIIDPIRTYEHRKDLLQSSSYRSSSAENLFSVLPADHKIKESEDILQLLSRSMKKGYEGLILRNPESYYQFGRTYDLLKVKEFDDMEAVVKGYYDGEGRNSGVIGGLICKMPKEDIEFRCGTGLSMEERKDPPKIGSLVTIRHFGWTNDKKPRHPIYVEVRNYE